MKELKRLKILSSTFVQNLSSKSIIPACPLIGFHHRPQFVLNDKIVQYSITLALYV